MLLPTPELPPIINEFLFGAALSISDDVNDVVDDEDNESDEDGNDDAAASSFDAGGSSVISVGGSFAASCDTRWTDDLCIVRRIIHHRDTYDERINNRWPNTPFANIIGNDEDEDEDDAEDSSG